jgi:uncharacterized membrane protein
VVKPTLPFGVRVPVDRIGEPVIAAQARRYRILVALTGVAAAVIALVLGSAGYVTWLAPVLLLASMVLYWVYFYVAHRRIRQAKQSGHWYEERSQVVAADTRLRTDPPRFPWPWALPAVLVVVATLITLLVAYPTLPDRVPVHYNASGVADRWAAKSLPTLLSIVVVQAALTVLIVGLCRLTFRAPAQVDAEEPEASANRHRRYVVALARAFLCFAALVDLTLAVASRLMWQRGHASALLVVGMVVPAVVGTAIVLAPAIRMGQSGSRLAVDAPVAAQPRATRDDDANWRAGMLYVNRHDQALFVPKRFGVGWTLNFGHPVAWIVLGLVVAAAVVPVLYSNLAH